jgi:hypothetical protein
MPEATNLRAFLAETNVLNRLRTMSWSHDCDIRKHPFAHKYAYATQAGACLGCICMQAALRFIVAHAIW